MVFHGLVLGNLRQVPRQEGRQSWWTGEGRSSGRVDRPQGLTGIAEELRTQGERETQWDGPRGQSHELCHGDPSGFTGEVFLGQKVSFWFLLLLFSGHAACGILVPQPIPRPLQWKLGVLTAGPPGKSQKVFAR